MNFSFKKTIRPSEQDRLDIAQAREKWQHLQSQFDPARLVFLDESGAKTNMTRLARALRGQHAHGSAPHGHWKTTTLISSIRLDAESAAMTISGATDTEVFRAFISKVLYPTLRSGEGNNPLFRATLFQ